MKKSATVVFLSLSMLWSSYGQNLRYEIVKGEKVIGSLEAKKKTEKDQVTFSLRNSVEFKVLFSFNILYELEEVFVDDMLISGKGKNSLNDATQKETSIRKTENGYNLDLDGTPNHISESGIDYSVSRIYHEEPYDGKPVFSEYFGRFLQIEKIGSQKYLLKSPDGENEYTYDRGYCTEVKVTRDFATFYIRMDATTLALVNKGN